MRILPALFLIGFLAIPSSAFTDGIRDNDPTKVRRVPKDGIEVPEERAAALRSQLSALQQKIATIEKSATSEAKELLPDVMIFERAIRCALDFDEFFSTKDIDKADELADEGIRRADQLIAGKPEWPTQSGLVVRGYVSRIDDTVQPYGLVVPETYAFNQSVPTRCDLWFHGRGETLSEVNFIHGRMKTVGQYAPEHTIVLHPYGRYSNAFKFAGETDVLEALKDVQNRYRIDEDRISVRGFSMGGAACWQFAVHYADRWFAANPGAGFSETPQFLDFFQKETLRPKPWEKKLWNLYDCDQYAMNLTHCPTIAYSGENDIQKQAADVMEEALAKRGIQLRHVIGAEMGHKIDNQSKQLIGAGMDSLAKRVSFDTPRKIVFQTHTLKYNRMHWLTVHGLEEHWQPAVVRVRTPGMVNSADMKRSFIDKKRGAAIQAYHVSVDVGCDNVSDFSLTLPPGQTLWPQNPAYIVVRLHKAEDVITQSFPGPPPIAELRTDGPFSDGTWSIRCRKENNEWSVVDDSPSGLHKRHGLQGPIDDAFMESFIFVRSTGKAANELVGKWADAELERAIVHWRRHFRGDARVVNDTEVTDGMIKSANLILWGDPVSNSVMAKIADKLPIKWQKKTVSVGKAIYDAAHHAPILIYPNPLNQDRYVVLNSSFTFRDYAYLNNARQVPMLPDWSVIDLKTPPGNVWPGEVVAADFFDENWKLK